MEDKLNELWELRHPHDKLFLSIFNGYHTKIYKNEPHSIYFINDNKILMRLDTRFKQGFLIEKYIWEVFQSSFDMNYIELNNILKILIEIHLNIHNYSFDFHVLEFYK